MKARKTGGYRAALVWRKSVYDAGFMCACGRRLADEKGNSEGFGLKRSGVFLFCPDCGKAAARIEYVNLPEGVSGPRGDWQEFRREQDKPREDEIEAWTVGVGNLPPIPTGSSRKALELIRSLEGFIGIHPLPPMGTLLLFRSENDAIRGKNLLDYKGVKTSRNISKVFIEKKYAQTGEELKEDGI